MTTRLISDAVARLRTHLASLEPTSALLFLRKDGTTEADNQVVSALQGPNGGLLTELAVLATGAATSALQTALNALVTTLNGLVATPTIPTAITPSDVTDTSAVTTKGLVVSVAGNLSIRGTGAPAVTVTFAVVAGQYVPFQCSRVMGATTATVVGAS